jgi:glycosyltransferase involved in cell wall biosynthesis
MTVTKPVDAAVHVAPVPNAGVAGEPKKNLLLLATSLWIGGAETVIRHLAERLDREQFNVSVCYLKQRGYIGDELAKAGIDIVGIHETDDPEVDYFTFRKLLKVIRSRNIDVVHTHTTHGLVDASLCKLFRPRLKVLHTFHFGNYPHTTPRIVWMERVFSRFVDALYAVGEVQRGQLKNVFGFRDKSIRTIWNGVQMPNGHGDPGFRASIGAEHCTLIGTIATLIEQKGLRDLMAVAKRVCDAGHNVKFVIVGEGKLRPELEALRASLGLDDKVILTGWVTSAADVTLPSFDIFFQPSLWEAMSVVTLEAMANGKPVVATRVGEAPNVIENGVDGMLVDAKDIAGMAGALERLIVDPELRRRMGQTARQTVERKLTVDHMTRAYERAYMDVLS